MTTPKLTPTQIAALKSLEASGDFLPSWNVPGPISVLDKLCQNRLVELRDRTMMTQPTKARITEAGRQALAALRAEEAAKEVADRARPLSTAEIDALRVALDNGGTLQCVVSGTWSTAHGRTGSFPSRVINTLVRRCFFVKLDADTVSLTGDGEALAKIKEDAR